MSFGITPIDNALEIHGLEQAGALVRYLFIETVAGKCAFGAGFIISLYRSVKTASVRPFMVFLAIFAIEYFLLVLPAAPVRDMVSAMEERGYHAQTTTAILENLRTTAEDAPLVLLSLVRMTNVLAQGGIDLIDHGGKKSFLTSPFLLANLDAAVAAEIHRGITSVELRDRVRLFYWNVYFPAVQRLAAEKKEPGAAPMWPGAKAIRAVYHDRDRSEWDGLYKEIYASVNGLGGIADKAASLREDPEQWKAGIVRSVLDQEFNSQARTAPAAMMAQAITVVLARWPYVYGGLLWGLYLVYPLVLLVILVQGHFQFLGAYGKGFVAVKLGMIFLAVIDTLGRMVAWGAERAGPDGWLTGAGFSAFGIVGVMAAVMYLCLRAIADMGHTKTKEQTA